MHSFYYSANETSLAGFKDSRTGLGKNCAELYHTQNGLNELLTFGGTLPPLSGYVIGAK